MGNVNTVDRSPPPFVSVGTQRRPFCCGCLQQEDERARPWMICSRCKVAPYCSKECQKKHFESHKSDCKLVASVAGNDEQVIQHQRTVFAVCYRTCEDYRNVHWEPCIDACNYTLSCGQRDYQVHDQIALAWLGLEKLQKALEETVKNVEFGPDPDPNIKVRDLTVLDDTEAIPKAWDTEWSETNLLILLAIKMQVVAQLRAAAYGPDLEAAMSEQEDRSVPSILKEQERQVKRMVQEIGQWWGGRIAYVLRDARPLTKRDLPNLTFSEPEHFLVLQDVFFKTEGVEEVLYEFVN